jgi:WD40 repeat protein
MQGNLNESQIPIIKPLWAHQVQSGVMSLGMARSEFVLALENGNIACHDLVSGAARQSSVAHSGSALQVNYSPSGKYIASSGEDGFLRVFESKSLKVEFEEQISKSWAEWLSWSPKDDFVVASSGKCLLGWKPGAERGIRFSSVSSTVGAIAWLDANTFGVGYYGGLNLFSFHSANSCRSFNWKGSIISAQFSPRKDFVACGAQDSSIHLWDLATGEDLEMSGFHAKSREISFHHSGNWMANAAGEDLTVWDFRNGSPAGTSPKALGTTPSPLVRMKFQRNGDCLFGCEKSGVIFLWSPFESDLPVGIAGIRNEPVSCADWTVDDRGIVTGLKNGYVLLYPVPERSPSREAGKRSP